jgi:FtsP/CotA-like multicopper oxidase with cupredoxin domain
MSSRRIILAASAVMAAVPLARSTGESRTESIWGRICAVSDDATASATHWAHSPSLPVAKCPPAPTSYQSLPSIGDGGDTSVNFSVGYDADAKRLCFVATGLSEAPVLRVGVGHTLSVQIANTLHDTGPLHETNCPIDTYGGEGYCTPKPVYPEAPGPDGTFYPIMANEAHIADGTTNLHVHGLFVPPVACSDEVLASAIYPANWSGPVGTLPPCQSAPDSLSYTYQLPADHPAGVYWYHTHRHGQAEHETQMGLVGAIVVEDAGDAARQAIGVTDEVLLVTDIPNPACLVGPSCDALVHPGHTRRQDNAQAARALAIQTAKAPAYPQQLQEQLQDQPVQGSPVKLDPRIDQVDQAGECAYGASNANGGVELWTLMLNGVAVPESQDGFPPDSELLNKTMQPGQRQIFRLVNASANSFLAPELVLSQNGVETVLPLEVFARDGVGLADALGNRHFGYYDVAQQQLIVPPSSRIEFVVHAPPPGAKLYVQSSQVAPGCGGNLYPARRLLLVTPSGTPVNPGATDDSDLLQGTPSLAPYLATLGETATVHRTFVLSEYGRGFTYGQTKWPKQTPPNGTYDPTQTDFFITEVASDDGEVDPSKTAVKPFTGHNLAPQVVVHLHGQDSVTEDWLVENSTLEIHAFHMHQVHFRDLTSGSTNPDDHPLLDVINVPAAPLIGDIATGMPGAPGWVKVRMTFTKQDIGEFVFHCHILEHEDNGIMGKIKVMAD